MPDQRIHRGPHPEDGRLFAADHLPILRQAVCDYSLLLSKGYAQPSALKLVGDHFSLDRRQRLAVMRSACSDTQLAARSQREIPPSAAAEKNLLLDGYNILITLEAALSGAFLLLGRDGCLRDLSGIHGTWRKVAETTTALEWIDRTLSSISPCRVRWLLDRPVSNSGRLKTLIEDLISKNNRPWTVELQQNPDKILRESPDPIATGDSAVLDACHQWLNLTALALQNPPAASLKPPIIDLRDKN